MGTTANGSAGGRHVTGETASRDLLLHIGSEIVEVRIRSDGLHFRHPETSVPEGVLGWEEAIALALLPERARRHRSRSAA